MTIFPLQEIIFFIAAFFAPEEAKQINISGYQTNQISFIRSAPDKWVESVDKSIWVLDGKKVKKNKKETDVGPYVKGVEVHDWSKKSVLKLPRKIHVVKDKTEYIVYSKGVDDPKYQCRITYVLKQ